jgi:hypothetical protein
LGIAGQFTGIELFHAQHYFIIAYLIAGLITYRTRNPFSQPFIEWTIEHIHYGATQ